MDVVREQGARAAGRKVLIAGWSAYPRQLDFAAFRAIADEVGAQLWVDMAHFAGLVAAGLHPSPVPHAHVTSSTVHKTIGGPRSGFILTNDLELAEEDQLERLPRPAGRPADARHRRQGHRVQARRRARVQGPPGAHDPRRADPRRAPHRADDAQAAGIDVLTGGTDVHLVLVDLRNSAIHGQEAEDLLHSVGITVNRNAVPFDPRPPLTPSGVRIGTPALATRGFGDDEFTEVADIIAIALPAVPTRTSRRCALACQAHRRLPALRGLPPVGVMTASFSTAPRPPGRSRPS